MSDLGAPLVVTVLGHPSADGGFVVKGSLGGIRAIGERIATAGG